MSLQLEAEDVMVVTSWGVKVNISSVVGLNDVGNGEVADVVDDDKVDVEISSGFMEDVEIFSAVNVDSFVAVTSFVFSVVVLSISVVEESS
jgi:hypothetical protein